MLLAAFTVVAALGALIPMEFTIHAMGEMKPVRQRHVFATSTGIVRTIAVTAGRDVSEGGTLLELDSPELELEIRRTDGDLRTTEKKITSLEASRLDFGLGSSDSTNQMNTLGGELKEQLQRRDNLRLELDLLHLRRDELKVVSPINGRVVTWDLEQLLSHRPVSRGQRLLTISDTEGPWELELRVADEDTSDLVTALQANKSVPLDFVAITKPEVVHSTTLRSISDTVEIRSQGESPTVLCRADLPENLKESAVEGMSVRGRIHCGRRAAIVVLLDKFWRSVREHILFPWGW
jgi:multidrug efflux pump subunit AcrA (membrane-fusion protein)